MKYEIKYLKKGDEFFPKRLELLEDCPDVIFVMGDEKILNDFSIGVIGSRSCSEYGGFLATEIAEDLSRENIVIVSGMARGIDSAAHRGCLKVGGKTIAVLGSGFDNVYPKENECLLSEIVKNGGAVISEYLPYVQPFKTNFVARNRLIAALSDGVVLIEAKERSGSLSTIRFAKELEKKVFVVPGSVCDDAYEGSNRILADGAFCVRNSRDIFNKLTVENGFDFEGEECMKSNNGAKNILESVPESLRNVYLKIKCVPTSFESICLNLDELPSVILSKLTLLEMHGYIAELGGKNFIKLKKKS